MSTLVKEINWVAPNYVPAAWVNAETSNNLPDLRPIWSAPLTAPTNAQLAALANMAADIIVLRGWCQRAWVDIDDKVCALHALVVAVNHDIGTPAYELVATRAREMINSHDIPMWNDMPDRTKEEAIQLWRDVAKSFSE